MNQIEGAKKKLAETGEKYFRVLGPSMRRYEVLAQDPSSGDIFLLITPPIYTKNSETPKY